MWEALSQRLVGTLVIVEPLEPGHEERLYQAANDPEIWRWMPVYPIKTRETFHAWMEAALAEGKAGTQAPFAVLDAQTRRPIGSTRYLTIRPEHRGLEIGFTWMKRSTWGTGANAEAKLLLLSHAFDDLACMRVEFKTEATNERSRAALEALPARFEGVSRKHMLVRGGDVRDSAYYAITDDEWPAVKTALRARVAAQS